MISEVYVSYEVAKLLKEKGFDECIFEFYEGDRIKYAHNSKGFRPSELPDIYYPHITQQMAMKWLREIYQIDIQVFRHIRGKRITFYARIEQNTHLEHQDKCNLYQSYEQACEAAIKYCLENLI